MYSSPVRRMTKNYPKDRKPEITGCN
ncbi:hypothetical protein ACQ27_gp278 [Klebsiella phage K64-1]|nr:hypothetical protein ACQ27_gp278 [Klebsiella phage K64-1]